jgi:hypothetical protein
MPSFGLATKSTAPSSSARIVVVGSALGQRRDHHHRHRPQPHQPLEKVEAVHFRHLDVEREHVRIERLDHLARHQRVGRGADHFEIALAIDDVGQQAAHQRRVIDDQHAGLAHDEWVSGIRTVRHRR